MSSDTMEALFRKYQTIILPILAVLVALILFATIVIPQGLKVPETNTQIQKSQADLQALTTKESILETIDPSKFQDDINTSLQALPPDPDIAGVFNQILITLSANGLTLDDVSISQVAAQNSNDLANYEIKVSSSGSTDSINNFIEQTKQIPRVIKVEGFDVGNGVGSIASTNRSQVQGVQILVTVQTFYKNVPKTQSLDTSTPLQLPTDNDQKTLNKIRDEINALPALATQTAVTLPSGKTDPFQ